MDHIMNTRKGYL